MSRKPDHVLRQIFSHPIPMNIKWRDVTHMFESLGAELHVVHGGREKIRLNGKEHTFHIPHGNVIDSKDEVVGIKHFLESAGITHTGH